MDMDLEALKGELDKNTVSEVVNKHIFKKDPICFSGDEVLISELRRALAEHFNLHLQNIEVVGSAKLGISLSNERLGKPYDKYSDIDIALVSSELFDLAWFELTKLESISYKLLQKDRDFLGECLGTISKGYISPDKLPPISNFSKNWWSIFSGLSSQKKYEYRKIRGRLFKDWWFSEKYYSIQLNKLKKGGT
jgi:hypothetical protein